LNFECIECNNYFDNWDGCASCSLTDDQPEDCLGCKGNKVLLKSTDESFPLHQCGYRVIDNCDSQPEDICEKCSEGYFWNQFSFRCEKCSIEGCEEC